MPSKIAEERESLLKYQTLLSHDYALFRHDSKDFRDEIRRQVRSKARKDKVKVRSADDQFRCVALMVKVEHLLSDAEKELILCETGYHVCVQPFPPLESIIGRVDTPYCAWCGTAIWERVPCG